MTQESEEKPQKIRHPSFLATLFLGALVFLATQNAIAGAVLPSLQSGYRLFRTGLWILRNDEEPIRGKVCFVFYLSAAFWMGSAAAFLSMLLFGAISEFTGNNPDMDRFAAIMITLTCCVAISSLFGIASILAALKNRIRVWVHPGLQDISDGSPNLVACYETDDDEFNYAIFVVATSLAFPLFAIGCATLVKNPTEAKALAVLLGGSLVTVISYAWLSSRVIANYPAECWENRNS